MKLDCEQQAPPHPMDEAESAVGDNLPLLPKMRILGCSAKDEADEVALLMFQQLLGPTRYEIEVIGDEKLTSEVVAEAGEKQTGLVCIAAVQPGGLTHTRYLCKRLRAVPDLKLS